MEFKEFTEYSNPEQSNYDLKLNVASKEKINNNQSKKENKYSAIFNDLYFDLGCPEIYELEPFGIDETQFNNPTKETLEKLQKYAQYQYVLATEQKNKGRK